MTIIAYARVSSTAQSLEIQEQQLHQAGAERIFAEKQSGTSTAEREELARCLAYVREGDVLVVTRLDRLARSIVDLRNILAQLGEKNVGFRCLHQPIDTTTAEGRLMLYILGAFAEFETEIRKERQMEGIAKAKAEGRYAKAVRPRKPVADEEIRALRDKEGLGATAIAKRLGLGRATVYRRVPDGWDKGVGV